MSDSLRHLLTAGLAACLATCSALGGGGGGAENLPNRGIVPYRAPAPDASPDSASKPRAFHVLSPAPDSGDSFEAPSAVLAASGKVVLFATLRPGDGAVPRIVRAEGDRDGMSFGPVETVVGPSALPEWAASGTVSPGVSTHKGSWLLAFATADGEAIGLARSADGRSFEVMPVPILRARDDPREAGGIGSPSPVTDGPNLLLAYEARAEAGGAPEILLLRATSAEGSFERAGAAIAGGEGCTDAKGEAEPCWDADGVSDPELRAGTSGAGRSVLRLFYVGHGSKSAALGFAASFEGSDWQRFPYNPVLTGPGRPLEPSNLALGGTYLLYYGDGGRIAVATNDAGNPAESF